MQPSEIDKMHRLEENHWWFQGKKLLVERFMSSAGIRGGNFLNIQERQVLLIIICAHFAILLAMGLFRHWGNMSSLNDLGFFDQAVWGTLHGQWFLDTNNTFGRPINWLGCHFNLFLLLFVPLYAIWPTAEWFAFAQAIALSVTAWPIFIIASRVHGSERTGLLWAVIYLLNPFLLSAAAWDFHPVTLAVPLIAGALLAIEKKDFRLFTICCLLQLLIQEQFGLTVAGFAVLWGIRHQDWKRGFLLVTIGILYTVLVPGFIMPALYPNGTHPMIDQGAVNSRYGWLGGSFFDILGNIALHPLLILKTALSQIGITNYFIFLSLPLLGLFFAAPVWLLPALADLAANTLSANPMPREIFSYHSVTLVPILTVAAIYGARRIAALLAEYFTIPLAKLVLLFTLLGLLSTLLLSYGLAPLPLPGALDFWRPVQWTQTPDPAIKRIRTLIAKHSSLSVQANVGAHFSQHQQVYRYPYKTGEADIIVLWLDSPTRRTNPHDGYGIGSITHHLQMKPAAYLASVECLLQDPAYGVILWDDPWVVISRGQKDVSAGTLVSNRLTRLRHTWKVSSEEYETSLKGCRNKLQ